MNSQKLSASRARQILSAATKTRVLVVGDVMLDQFIWGGVSRISPEAPVRSWISSAKVSCPAARPMSPAI
jgi:acyl carrier protein phosphodiesterase